MQKFTISRDDSIYEAFPCLALTKTGRLVCVFSECTHHADRSFSNLVYTVSDDRGATWSPKRSITQARRGDPKVDCYWNCGRVTALSDGRLMVVLDKVGGKNEGTYGTQSNWLWTSDDNGDSWQGPRELPVRGIVPDQIVELKQGPHAGRLTIGAHTQIDVDGSLVWHQRCWTSDDKGDSWQGPYTIAAEPRYMLCEGSIVELPQGELVCFMRENSGLGLDAFKAVSRDGGQTWTGLVQFPLPGCHRPVAGMLQNDMLLITHRFMQGGNGWVGWWTQNTFAALTDVESALAAERSQAHARILPLDFDRSPHSDTGYTGWIQFDDGEIYVVNYILDDAPKGQIRGYRLTMDDFYAEPNE